LYRKDAVLTLI